MSHTEEQLGRCVRVWEVIITLHIFSAVLHDLKCSSWVMIMVLVASHQPPQQLAGSLKVRMPFVSSLPLLVDWSPTSNLKWCVECKTKACKTQKGDKSTSDTRVLSLRMESCLF